MFITNPNINYLIIFLSQIVLFAVIYVLAIVLKRFFKQIKVGKAVLLVWALMINILLLLDFFEVSKFVYIPFFLAITGFIGLRLYFKAKQNNKFVHRLLASLKRHSQLLLLWFIGFIVLALPIFVSFPAATEVTGVGVSNDYVTHTIFMSGYKSTRDRAYTGLPYAFHYNNGYPRGIHAVGYFLSKITHQETQLLPLSLGIFSYSMVFLSFYDLKIFRRAGLINKILATAIVSIPFTALSDIYVNFLSQIAVTPFVVYIMIRVLNFKRPLQIHDLISDVFLLIATLNVYGVFILVILAPTYIVRLIVYRFRAFLNDLDIQKGIKKFLKPIHLKNNKGKLALYIISAVAFLAPAIFLMATMSYIEIVTDYKLNLLSSFGNLSSGFVSPFQIAGIWHPDYGYRAYLSGDQLYYNYVLLLIIAIQLYFIFKLKHQGVKVSLMLLVAWNFFAIFYYKNPYVHFKFFSYYASFHVIAFTLGVLDYKFAFMSRIVKTLLLATFLGLAIYANYNSIAKLPNIPSHEFNMHQQIKDQYLDKYSTLFLTYNEITQLYRYDKDDYNFLTGYSPTPEPFKKPEILIYDTHFDAMIQNGLRKREYTIETSTTNEACKTLLFDRYRVIDLECAQAL